MRRTRVAGLVLVMGASVTAGALPTAEAVSPGRADRLDAYTASVDREGLATLADSGFDLTEAHASGDRTEVSVVADPAEADRLRAQGVELTLTRVKGGQTVRQYADAMAAGGYQVWRSYDEQGGIRDQLYAAQRANPQLVRVVRLGRTYQGREILAAQVTQGVRGQQRSDSRADRRPAVLFSSTQHAREWISTEVNRRALFHYVDGWNAGDPDVRRTLRTTELWFVLVANPDGYQYTFDVERLWRKNLRDNNGDGEIQVGDGVDPNRNFDAHWGYENEGSSPVPASETYRGPAPGSEPETRALAGLIRREGFVAQVNWHSAGQWLLYPEGWQTGTPSADDPIYHALSGNLDEPAIPEFHPGISSDVLYSTNGETTDFAQAHGTLAWTPELSEGCEGCGFVFPDDPALVQAEFERVLPFVESVVGSAGDPADPTTVTGVSTKALYVRSADPYKDGLPEADYTFATSYGDPQPVDVLARKDLRVVRAHYRIDGGRERTADTRPVRVGERYRTTGIYYERRRALIRGTDPGQSVEVWFEDGRGRNVSDAFTYETVSETGHDVLVVAAEDYTGASPTQTPGPHYLDYYLDALAANGVDADVYDIDAAGRVAPDALGVLSHYEAVVMYTGDDLVTRAAGRGAGNADRLALDELYELRSFLNAGGRVMLTGDNAAQQYTPNVGNQFYDPQGEIACNPLPAGVDPRRCLLLRGSGDGTNDVLEYYLGAYLALRGDGIDDAGNAFGVAGVAPPYDGLSWGLNGPESADNQANTSSFVSTSGVLPPDEFPQFESRAAARFDKPGGPFDPHSGSQYAYSQIADVSYKRLTREVAVPAGGGELSFWASYDTELDWDFVTVEARTAGGSDWTTLPDLNGHTTTATGASCDAGWRDLHPQLDAYQTFDEASGTCTATGDTGAWHAASGNSGGWQEWRVDLSPWAGQTVEVSVSYVSDWATQNLGVFVDDVTLPDGSTESFESGLGAWAVTGAPPGSGANGNDWVVTDASGFPAGSVIATPRTLLLGFGLEGVSTADERAAVMGRALDHLLG